MGIHHKQWRFTDYLTAVTVESPKRKSAFSGGVRGRLGTKVDGGYTKSG